MIQVIDGEIKLYSLPKTGILKNGETVSGYQWLDEETLKEEGWLPLEDNPPCGWIISCSFNKCWSNK